MLERFDLPIHGEVDIRALIEVATRPRSEENNELRIAMLENHADDLIHQLLRQPVSRRCGLIDMWKVCRHVPFG